VSSSNSYYIVAIKDHEGSVSFLALKSSEYKQREKQLAEDYKEACKAWVQARKLAKANGEEFSDPKPKTPIIRKDKKRYKGKEGKSEADAAAAALQQKYEEKQRAREDKDSEETEAKSTKADPDRKG
jgi:hypothetical protein